MEQENNLQMIHISELSNAHSINEDDLLLISKYDETIDKNYVSMKSTIGQLQSNISSAIKKDIGIDDIRDKLNKLINSYNNLSSYTISCDITNPYIISSMFFKYGVLQDAGGYELTSAMNSAFKNVKYDEIKVKTLNTDNLSSNIAKIENLEIDGHGDIIDFINSSIEHNAAFYVTKDTQGNAFQTYNQLSTQTNSGNLYRSGIRKTPSQNDYCVVLSDETMNSRYPGSYDISSVYSTRYSWVEDTTIPNLSGKWEFKYVINNSPYTKIQWDTINSGISKETVVKHTSNTQIGSPTLPVYVDRNGNINPTPNISVTNLTSTNAHISGLTSNSIIINGKGDIIKYIDNTTSGAKTSVNIEQQQTSGTLIATISVDGIPKEIYAPQGSSPGPTIIAGQGLTYNSSTGEIKINDTIYGIIQALSGLANINSIVITES